MGLASKRVRPHPDAGKPGSSVSGVQESAFFVGRPFQAVKKPPEKTAWKGRPTPRNRRAGNRETTPQMGSGYSLGGNVRICSSNTTATHIGGSEAAIRVA